MKTHMKPCFIIFFLILILSIYLCAAEDTENMFLDYGGDDYAEVATANAKPVDEISSTTLSPPIITQYEETNITDKEADNIPIKEYDEEDKSQNSRSLDDESGDDTTPKMPTDREKKINLIIFGSVLGSVCLLLILGPCCFALCTSRSTAGKDELIQAEEGKYLIK
ncbi:hypothetical protein XENTR_v10014456 [Xenopus tropicalis]|nr:hypothetical protein XENTR_v10014456 [Xenopus tropicalis]